MPLSRLLYFVQNSYEYGIYLYEYPIYSTVLYPLFPILHGTSTYGYGYKYGISRIRLVSHRAIP